MAFQPQQGPVPNSEAAQASADVQVLEFQGAAGHGVDAIDVVNREFLEDAAAPGALHLDDHGGVGSTLGDHREADSRTGRRRE